ITPLPRSGATGCPSSVTWTTTAAIALDDEMVVVAFFESCVLVYSPVTREGRMSRVVWLALGVWMVVVSVESWCWVSAPVAVLMVHASVSISAAKLPLLWANAVARRPPTSVSTARRVTKGCRTGRLRAALGVAALWRGGLGGTPGVRRSDSGVTGAMVFREWANMDVPPALL